MMRDHRLVRGDQRLARAKRVARQRQRRSVGAADHLDDDIDIVRRDQRVHIVFPAIGGQVDAAVLVPVTRRHRDDLDRAPGAARDQVAIRFEQPHDAAADNPDSRKRHTQRRTGSGRGGMGRHAGLRIRRGATPRRCERPIGFCHGNNPGAA